MSYTNETDEDWATDGPIILDFAKATAPLPEGYWRVIVSEPRIVPTKAGDSKNLAFELHIMDAADPEHEGRTLSFVNLSLKPKALWALVEPLSALVKENLAEVDGFQLSKELVASLAGRSVIVLTAHEPYEQRVNNVPQRWFADGTVPDDVEGANFIG